MMKYFAVNVLTRSANLPIYKSYALKLKTTQILSYFKKANEAKLTLSRPKAEQIGTLQAFFALSCHKHLF